MVFLSAFVAHAQNYAINWFKISGGGGTSVGGQFGVNGTIGQPDAGKLVGGNYTLQGGFWSAYVAVQTPGAPLLAIKRVGDNVEIIWPAEATGFVLEETSSLSGTISWLGVGPAPTVIEGQNVVTLSIVVGQHFFRLRQAQD